MESIFHEKQEGYLCAQHCLNALLQGPYFNAVDLANLAQQMDEEERIRMAESGVDSEDYQHFLEQPSGNMDDSGYFSVQVISSALKVWGLELVPYNSTEPVALIAQDNPSQMKAYICNYTGHWFTIRKLGNQWFNLNSMLKGPQLISDTYLTLYLAQLIQEGYSIFIVIGSLPQCSADDVVSKNPVVSAPNQKNVSALTDAKGYRLGTKAEDEEKGGGISAKALAPLLRGSTLSGDTNERTYGQAATGKPVERLVPIKIEGHDGRKEEEDGDNDGNGKGDDDDDDLQRALELSLQDNCESIDEPLKLRLNLETKEPAPKEGNSVEELDEDDELRKAVQLSLECMTAPPTPDQDDIRWRRLSYFTLQNSRTPNTEASPKVNT